VNALNFHRNSPVDISLKLRNVTVFT